jgi:phosphoenolpyruvate phosphomutase
MGNHELEEAERRYLPARGAAKAIVLAASGGAIGPNPEALPKCMVDIRGQPLLRRMVTTLNESGIRDVTVVRGYRKEALTLPGIATIDNDDYATSGELGSLAVAEQQLEGDSVVLYGDVLFRRYILDDLLAMEADIAIAVDALWQDRRGRAPTRVRDLVAADRGAGDYLDDEPAQMIAMGNDLPDSDVRGEWVGMVRFSAKGAALARAEIDKIRAEGTLASYDLPTFLTRLAKVHPIAVHYVAGHWLDVDDISDLAAARNFL